ncbi:MAG: MraY family glycosyltransferase [Spirochaetia bacterium]
MNNIFAIGLPFLINIILIPILIFLAHKYSWYDETNHRKIHSGEMPRIGGIGIFLSVFLGGAAFTLIYGSDIELFFRHTGDFIPLFIGVCIIHFVGLLDDFANLRARYKLWIQIGVALMVIFTKNYNSFTYLTFIDSSFLLKGIGFLISFIWIVGIINSINLIDGMDGLSGGVSAIAFFFMGLTSLVLGNTIGALLSFLVFGGVLGFLFYNFPPAKIFMGDSGSLFLGTMAALLPFYTLSGASLGYITIILAASFLIIPILDTFSAIIRRISRNKPFYTPDQDHLHHKLLYCGFRTHSILIIMYGITAAASLGVYWRVITRSFLSLFFILLVWIITIGFFFFIDKKFRSLKAD